MSDPRLGGEEFSADRIVRLLTCITHVLEKQIVPEITKEENKVSLDQVIRVIDLLTAHFDSKDIHLKRLIERSRNLEKEAEHIVCAADDHTDDVRGRLNAQRRERSKSVSISDEYSILSSSLSVEIPRLVEIAMNEDNFAETSKSLIRNIVESQEEFFASQDPDVLKGSKIVYRGGRIDRNSEKENRKFKDSKRVVSAESVAAYIRDALPSSEDSVVENFKIATGGFSKTTALFTSKSSTGESCDFALRKDLPMLLMGKTVNDEFPLLCKLYEAGLPVPRPVHLEPDPKIFDGAFFISEKVDGVADIESWSNNPKVIEAVIKRLAEIMSQLHSVQPSDLGYSAYATNRSAGEAFYEEIQRFESLYHKVKNHGHPLLEIAIAWVKKNIPQYLYKNPARVVHGDIGFHNLMVDKDGITALLDWEFWHFGDPAEDLYYVKPFVEQVCEWNSFLENYYNAGGLEYTKESEMFYRAWSTTRNAIATLDCISLFEKHLSQELKLAVAGYIFGPYVQLDASKMVISLLESKQH